MLVRQEIKQLTEKFPTDALAELGLMVLLARAGEGGDQPTIREPVDRIGHDRLIARLGRTIPDKRILRLIGMILRSGIMANGLVTPSTEGAVQGSPLSPLLSNIVLDELDKELERRGLEFCRFADDCAPRRRTGGREPSVQPCCTRDGGRPPEVAVQAEASNHPLLLPSREVVVSELGKGRARPGQVWTVESNASEPLMRCRKRRDDVKTGG